MLKKASKKDIFWGYLAQFLNVGSGVILIPIVLKYLSSEDLAIWYLFIALAGIAQLLEFGFQPTISRMTAYIHSGAMELKSEGLPKSNDNHKIDYQLLHDFIYSSKIIYRFVAVAVTVVLGIGGSLYLNTFEAFREDQFFAWVIFLTSTTINFYFTYFNGLMTGRGDQKELYRIMTFSKMVMLIIAIPLLISGYGLYAMAYGNIMSMFVFRLFLSNSFFNMSRIEIQKIKKLSTVNNYTKTIWLAAWKLGVSSFGAFLTLRANMFLASSFLGLQTAATYGVTLQVINVIFSLSAMLFNLNLPKFNAQQNNNDKEGLKKLLGKTLILSNLLYILGCASLFLIGIPLLEYISVNTSLVTSDLLLFMLFIYLLELNHSLCATYLTTLNKVPFLYASIISGCSIIILSFLTINFTYLGLLGLILSQFIVQALYNNWAWPLMTYRDFNIKKYKEI